MAQNPNLLSEIALQRTISFRKTFGQNGEQPAALKTWFSTGDKTGIYDLMMSEQTSVNAFIDEVINELKPEALKIIEFAQGCNTFASIGVGAGILEAFIVASMNFKYIALIDIENSSSHGHAFDRNPAGYASLDEAEKLLKLFDNELTIESVNPDKSPLPKKEIDLCISLYSMGFHYPVIIYIDYLISRIRSGGLLIFDLRYGANDPGISVLFQHFILLQTFSYNKDCIRAIMRRI